MKFLKFFLLAIGLLVGIFLLAGLFYPKELRTERTRNFDVPDERLKERLLELRGYQAWWPWTMDDGDTRYRYEGSAGGAGAMMEWEGGPGTGNGAVTLLSVGSDSIQLRLEFESPHESSLQSYFYIEEVGDGVRLHWGFEEELSFPTNAIPHFMNVDERMGTRFEQGLEHLEQELDGS